MKYQVALDGFDGQKIEVQTSGMFSGPSLLVNGQKAPSGPKRGEMLLRKNDGTAVACKWKSSMFGLDVPQLDVGGKVVQIAKPLKWYAWAWAALPILLLFVGGFLGAIFGVLAAFANMSVLRSSLNGIAKFVITAGITALAALLYVVGVVFVLGLLGR